MLLLVLLCSLRFVAIGLAQTTCRPHIPPSSGRVVLTYTPYVTPQVAPISTIYRRIVTAWTYAVDCRYVSISQVDDNQAMVGPFTGTPTTVDALTITRIGCIQQTMQVTRRDVVRGLPVETAVAIEKPDQETKRETSVRKRASLTQNVVDVALKQAGDIPPDAQAISVKAYSYMIQVNTALYAVNLYNTGFNMSATCSLLNDPVTQARLVLASIDPKQAEAIICYAANYGLFFDMSNTQLLSDLLGIIYSIEVKSGFTSDSDELCNSLRLGAASFLGIDAQGIRSYICDDQLSSTLSANQSTTTTYTPVGTGAAGTAGTVGTGSFGFSSGSITPPYANSTTSAASGAVGSVTVLSGTGSNSYLGTGSSPRSTGVPSNATNNTVAYPTYSVSSYNSSGSGAASDSFNIIFPNATAAVNASQPDDSRLPPTPTAAPYYAVWTTSTTSDARLPRY